MLLSQISISLLLMSFKSFDTVDRSILDRVLSSLGLPAWFRHAYFEYHLLGLVSRGPGMVESLRVCPLSMMFILALYLPWCKYLAAQDVVEPQFVC